MNNGIRLDERLDELRRSKSHKYYSLCEFKCMLYMLRLGSLKNDKGNGSKGSTVSLVAVVGSVYCQVSRLLEFTTLYILNDGAESICSEHCVKSITVG